MPAVKCWGAEVLAEVISWFAEESEVAEEYAILRSGVTCLHNQLSRGQPMRRLVEALHSHHPMQE
jgi:hypothetical protein